MHKIALIVVTVILAVTIHAQDRGPSTPEERAQALRLIRALEVDPLHAQAKDARAWLTVWIATVPDITVPLCGAFLGPLSGAHKNHSAELVTQMMFSSAAHVIEHPEQKDLEAKYLAGVEGSLRAYEAIRRQKPKVKWPAMDELIAKREAGELQAYVHSKMQACE